MIKLCLLIAFYQRPQITAVVMRHYRRMADAREDLSLIAVGSEGESSRKLAEENGWIYVEAPNRPLSDKLAHGVFRCLKENPEIGLVAMGSDDIVTEPWIDRCSKEQTHLLGLKDMYLFQPSSWSGLHWPGYVGRRAGESIGAHRFFPRHLLDRVEWVLWPMGLNCNLDGNLYRNIGVEPTAPLVWSMRDAGCAALGIASETNLTPWRLRVPGSVKIDPESIISQFPEETQADIRRLR